MKELKQCPFCGEDDLYLTDTKTHTWCDNRKCVIYNHLIPIKAWNTRPEQNSVGYHDVEEFYQDEPDTPSTSIISDEEIEDKASEYVDSVRNRIDGFAYLDVLEGFTKGANHILSLQGQGYEKMLTDFFNWYDHDVDIEQIERDYLSKNGIASVLAKEFLKSLSPLINKEV